jgi:hypothetical protein
MRILFAAIYLLFLACNSTGNGSSQHPETDSAKTDTVKKAQKNLPKLSKPEEFLSYFTKVEKPDLFIQYDNKLKHEQQFGKIIDEKYYEYLCGNGFGWDYTSTKKMSLHYFAYYQFNFYDSKVGLIMRLPGNYIESEISLFSYDPKDSTLTKIFKLADNIGDAGYYMELKSWLKDINGDGQPDIISHKNEYVPAFEQGNSDILCGLQYDSIYYYEGKTDLFIKYYAKIEIDSMKKETKDVSFTKVKTIKSDTVYFSGNKNNLINFKNYSK